MQTQPQTVLIYENEVGKHPYIEWFSDLKDRQARAKIETRIARLEAGNFGDTKSVGDGVVELRIDYGPGYRLYIGRDGNTTVILLCGGDKATQDQDITLAQKYWKHYRS